jgi:hypothetical protein
VYRMQSYFFSWHTLTTSTALASPRGLRSSYSHANVLVASCCCCVFYPYRSLCFILSSIDGSQLHVCAQGSYMLLSWRCWHGTWHEMYVSKRNVEARSRNHCWSRIAYNVCVCSVRNPAWNALAPYYMWSLLFYIIQQTALHSPRRYWT